MSFEARKHSLFSDAYGIAISSILSASGVVLIDSSNLITGGPVGIAQLLTHSMSLSLSELYILVSIPFFILAIWKKGIQFAIRSFLNVMLVSLLVGLIPKFIDIHTSNQLAVAIIASTMTGFGVLGIFRHNSSLGGFNVIGLIAQEKIKVQAGVIQAGLDLVVLAVGLVYYDSYSIFCSVVGAVVFNGTLAMYHRKDLYIGHSN